MTPSSHKDSAAADDAAAPDLCRDPNALEPQDTYHENWLGKITLPDLPPHMRLFVLNNHIPSSSFGCGGTLIDRLVSEPKSITTAAEKGITVCYCCEFYPLYGFFKLSLAARLRSHSSMSANSPPSAVHIHAQSAVSPGTLPTTANLEIESAQIWSSDAILYRYAPVPSPSPSPPSSSPPSSSSPSPSPARAPSTASSSSVSPDDTWKRDLLFLRSIPGKKLIVFIDSEHHSIARLTAQRMSRFLELLAPNTPHQHNRPNTLSPCHNRSHSHSHSHHHHHRRHIWTVYNPIPGCGTVSSSSSSSTAHLLSETRADPDLAASVSDPESVTFVLGCSAASRFGAGQVCLREFLWLYTQQFLVEKRKAEKIMARGQRRGEKER